MRNTILSRWNLVAFAFAFTLGAGACMTSDTDEGSSELATKNDKIDPATGLPGGAGGTGGPGGTCSDILAHGCDGTTGAKLEQCKKDIQNAFNACVKVEHCQQLRDAAAKNCGKDIPCLEKADQIFNACIGPSTDPTQPPKPGAGA
jgi:hypothetical protein